MNTEVALDVVAVIAISCKSPSQRSIKMSSEFQRATC